MYGLNREAVEQCPGDRKRNREPREKGESEREGKSKRRVKKLA